MRRLVVLSGLVAALWIAGAGVSTASPITIGAFAYDVDPFWGPVLTVHNTSSITTEGTFTDVIVYVPDEASPLFSIPLGPILSGDSANTSSTDLTSLISPFSARVTLTFTPLAAPSIHVVAQAFLTGLTLDFDDEEYVGNFVNPVSITIDSERLAPVPEPASLVLLSSGLATLVGAARRRRRASKLRVAEAAAARRFSP